MAREPKKGGLDCWTYPYCPFIVPQQHNNGGIPRTGINNYIGFSFAFHSNIKSGSPKAGKTTLILMVRSTGKTK